MSEQNKTIVRHELWNKGNLSVADELFAPTDTHHNASIEDTIAEGETVMPRWSCRGSRVGVFRNSLGLSATTHAFFAWLYALWPASIASCTWSFARSTSFCARCFKSLLVLRT
jgi:hypothetical protein